MRTRIFLIVTVAATPAQALTGSPAQALASAAISMSAGEQQHSARLDILDGEDFRRLALPDQAFGEAAPFAVTPATSAAVSIKTLVQPVDLSLDALAGHRAFDTMHRRRATQGWRLSSSGNDLGVGVTGSWGIDLGRDTMAMPFVSLDYDRIDTARFFNSTTPNPYSLDNADTGLTLTAGTQMSWRFGDRKRFRLGGYGAMVAATSPGGANRDAASAGTRIVQSLGSGALQPLYGDVGANLTYALALRMRLSGSLLQTVDRSTGDEMAFRVAFRMRY